MPTQRGAEVHLVPWNYDMSQDTYDGLFLSNGPGDPALASEAIANLKKVQCVDIVDFQERSSISSILCGKMKDIFCLFINCLCS